MTRLFALALAVLLAACGGGGGGGGGDDAGGGGNTGGGDNTGGGAPGGGGGNDTGGGTGGTPTTPAPLTVTGDLAFTPAGQAGVTATAVPCTVRAVSKNVSVVAAVVTSHPLACGVNLDDNEQPSSSTRLLIAVRRQRTDLQPAAAIEPGTYPIGSDDSGEARALVKVVEEGENGVPTNASIGGSAITGSVTLTRVGETIEGTLDANLSNFPPSKVTGSFSVPSCAGLTAAEICAGVDGSAPPTGQFPTQP